MTPADDRWIEMEYLEPDVAHLIRTAQGPASPDELAAEREIVSLMQETIVMMRAADTTRNEAAAPAPVPARRKRSVAFRRLVAAKTAALVALLALGMAAAEATTGVVSAVFPDREPEIERQITPAPTDPPKVPGPPGPVPPPSSVPNTDMPPPGRPRDDTDVPDDTATGTHGGGSGSATGTAAGSGNGTTAAATPTTTTPTGGTAGAGGTTSDPTEPTLEGDSPTTTDGPGRRGNPPGRSDDRPPPGHPKSVQDPSP